MTSSLTQSASALRRIESRVRTATVQVLKNIDKTEIFQTCRFSRQMKAVKTQKKKKKKAM